MSLDLRVLEHLGINLYSNAAAVLSEAVANSYDADSARVSVDITDEDIVIEDDGNGMTLSDINERFLSVGYDKRTKEGEKSPKGRDFMGRKGIGKLSLFSLAEVVDVHTRKGSERHAFRLAVADIRSTIKAKCEYRPKPIQYNGPKQGTKIVLSELTRKRLDLTAAALRKRIARRFAIIGVKSGHPFAISIGDQEVTLADRDDLRKIEFLWEFGPGQVDRRACKSLEKSGILPDVIPAHPEWKIRGWIGAAKEPKQLTDDPDPGSLNNIVVLARGRLIQEDILPYINYSRLSMNYITGVVQADFLDAAGQPDVATSDRQRIVEDDPRYHALLSFLKTQLVSIADQWTEWRIAQRTADAKKQSPALVEWLDSLPAPQRRPAEKLVGMIGSLRLDEARESDRKELYRSGIVAFERLRLSEESSRLSTMKELTVEALLPMFVDLASLEGALYADIVRSRLQVLKSFEGLVDADAKERVLQEHLFKNLWLLDTAWERATDSQRMEQRLRREFPKQFGAKLSDKETKGRYDIKYKTVGGRSVLVELKRADRRLHLSEVLSQVSKYFNALTKCLQATGEQTPHIEIAVVVGQPLYEEADPDGPKKIQGVLREYNARVMHYETLITHAQQAYAEYLTHAQTIDRVQKIVNKL